MNTKFKITFKHKRHDFVQAVYGSLEEEASFLAVEQTKKRLEELFEEIEEAAKESEDFCETVALEMCINKAKTNEELIVFIHETAKAQRCPSHGLVQMIMGGAGSPPKG
jgi:pyruvate-formate lyase